SQLIISGAYRKLIVVPKDVKWEILPYTDVTKPLLLSDFEILQGTTELIIDKSGPLKALKLEFQLPPLCLCNYGNKREFQNKVLVIHQKHSIQ
ncbi:pseudouridylate synthase 7, partial [Caerostris extrusa]